MNFKHRSSSSLSTVCGPVGVRGGSWPSPTVADTVHHSFGFLPHFFFASCFWLTLEPTISIRIPVALSVVCYGKDTNLPDFHFPYPREGAKWNAKLIFIYPGEAEKWKENIGKKERTLGHRLAKWCACTVRTPFVEMALHGGKMLDVSYRWWCGCIETSCSRRSIKVLRVSSFDGARFQQQRETEENEVSCWFLSDSTSVGGIEPSCLGPGWLSDVSVFVLLVNNW